MVQTECGAWPIAPYNSTLEASRGRDLSRTAGVRSGIHLLGRFSLVAEVRYLHTRPAAVSDLQGFLHTQHCRHLKRAALNKATAHPQEQLPESLSEGRALPFIAAASTRPGQHVQGLPETTARGATGSARAHLPCVCACA